MFRKLVANLSFSPALITEVGFYANRLRKETSTRQLTVFFMILALIVQSLTIFSPPESVNASSKQTLLRGGITSKEDFLERYRANESNSKDIINSIGITEKELAASQAGTVTSSDNAFIINKFPRFGSSNGEIELQYIRSDTGLKESAYLSPLNLITSEEYKGWIGQSSAAGWFSIIQDSGNFLVKTLPSTATAKTTGLSQQLTTLNLSQGNVAADTLLATAGDRISYTIIVQNTGQTQQIAPLAIPLSDALEYSSLIDSGGGQIDNKSDTLSWPPVALSPGQTEQRTFVIQLLNPLPATAKGLSDPLSYDCKLTTAYGNTSTIDLKCPEAKEVEGIISMFPTIGSTGSSIFALVILSIALFFYLRTRQLKTEIRLIRHNLNEGAL